MKNISEIINIPEDYYDLYGRYIAKVSLNVLDYLKNKRYGKLILVTAMTPTPAGEGKTTTAIGLGNALKLLGKNAGIAIREPSLGPCFGVKGGATGGGKSTVEPSNKINLMFTGDFPAVSAAHNLLSAVINNHMYHGNELKLDPKNIVFPRTIDMDDRSLRSIIVGSGDRSTGVMMNDKYVITAASEVMAILALSRNYNELKQRLGNIMIGYNLNKAPIFARDLKVHGAMASLLVDALRPNIAQTSEHVPAIIHTGPFGNIAHGTSSILGDIIGLKMFDYLVTEAGFGSDLGFEKFIDIVLRLSDFKLSAVVLVATVRAMRYHGGGRINEPDVNAVLRGSENLMWHVQNIKKFGFNPVVAINRHSNDTDAEINAISNILTKNGVEFSISDAYSDGGHGALDLAGKVLKSISDYNPRYIYGINDDPEEKISKIAMNVYNANSVEFSHDAVKTMKLIKDDFSDLYVCMAKTQSSISDNAKLINVPEGFTVKINGININSGSGFIIPLLGNIMTMPGLPRRPASENIDIDDYGNITGLQ
ncbi:formate--tetrahydrofolate ligase [Picrophilus oshimae]|uniref:Formate--tetrahydrofolate ligase n=1 Tax=Picrophilus torridus (strain ATCC 700027 / DSM 9790 / JCM 10055 / NBRC 100828 / KAW 2/3) TaxID=1122961 RepID=FTHS_PICTO|nr:formate--tetrahydrofolate ligase [Picrophilus oshimae]Q6KZM3.1 RecName: Full=Formate--tetrahydrofolate ligase; AltName: Full=Formyltetrahydrofolate synthetase; Short=FHS; Short=FTHFS [Picrophilus oshimae DSM 9789]AAT43829.1 formate--tetrahydrofolate ligase [Picrophilus oshimae DSM 9789]